MSEPAITQQAFHDDGPGNLPPTRVVIHATCPVIGYPRASSAGMAAATASYFTSPGAGGSAHYVVDIAGEEHCVPDGHIAWHAPPNQHSIGIEVCSEGGDYSQSYTREQWLSPDVWPAVIRAAARTRELCGRFGIPMQRINSTDLLDSARGICGHVDVSQAWHQSDHSDPGPGFPWPEFLAAVNGSASAPTTSKDDPMSVIPIPLDASGNFRVLVPVEAGASSAVIARAFITFGSAWGGTEFKLSALGPDGVVMGRQTVQSVPNNKRGFIEVPDGAVLATIEGKASPGAVPAAALVCLNK